MRKLSIKRTSTLVGLTTCGLLATTIWLVPASHAVNVHFTSSSVATSIDGATSLEFADLDGDGDLDLIGAAQEADDILWWENNGSGFNAALTIDSSFNGAFTVRAADIDQDGDLDVVAAGLQGDNVYWWENDGTPANNTTDDGNGNFWNEYQVDISLNGARYVDPVDLDQDGDLDLLVSALLADRFVWYENDGTPKNNTTNDGNGNFWTQRNILTGADGAAMALGADIDGDGDLDVAAVARNDDTVLWLENDGDPLDGGWVTHTVQPAFPGDNLFDGPRAVEVADFDGDGDLDIAAVAADSGGVKVWENDGTPADDMGGDGNSWDEDNVSSSPNGPFFLLAADIDSDGDPDLLVSEEGDNELVAFENSGNNISGFDSVVASGLVGARGFAVGDADLDGDLDAAGVANVGDLVALATNDTVHRTAKFQLHPVPIDTVGNPLVRDIADLDRDGDLDLVGLASSQVLWWQNDDSPQNDTAAWSWFMVGAPDCAIALEVVDVNVDGRPDLYYACSGNVGYYEATGDPTLGPSSWTQRFIRSSGLIPVDAVASDLDRDGDVDLIVADSLNSTVYWFENDRTLPDDGSQWSQHGIASGIVTPDEIAVADIDHDGDPDVQLFSGNANPLAWFENDGTPANDSSWTEHGIRSSGFCDDSVVADIDNDGDLDALACRITGNSGMTWMVNDGSPANDASWSEVTVSSVSRARNVGVEDLDLDGDRDLWTGGFAGFGPGLEWFANDGTGTFAPADVLEETFGSDTKSADLDHNGLPDLVVSRFGEPLHWFRNRAGQVLLEGQSREPLGPGANEQPLTFLASGERRWVLSIDAEHRGRTGDVDALIGTFAVVFQDVDTATGLEQAEVNALFSDIDLYWESGLDNPTSFDSLDPLLVPTPGGFLHGSGGKFFDLAGNPSEQTVTLAAPQRYYLVLTTEPDAHLALPNRLRIGVDSSIGDSTDSNGILLDYYEYRDTRAVGAHALVEVSSCGAGPDHLDIVGPTTLTNAFEQACMTITTSGDVEVNSGISVLNAVDSVSLGSGFSVGSGAGLIVITGELVPPN